MPPLFGRLFLSKVSFAGEEILRVQTIIPTAIIGAVVGVAIGYAVASLSRSGTYGFMIWAGLDSEYAHLGNRGDALAWAIGGAVVGAAAGFLWRQNSN
ncbi:hypothetical protein [Bradyrhizobium sp. CIR3A]|uniref:hypothetical protein n=1 Tax=Bradyrhizobium sp. CIR3A TaxID=2663838 RepID=UPI00160685E2|nr:hypothetical protein [Bradyrhizobium sp. CIR3A]MBB4264286.1 hypothetical protein [Bradyrhizobium sp. CIR3A]